MDWHPEGHTADAAALRGRRISFPSRATLQDWAERLSNFDDWLHETGRDWKAINYLADIVQGYQADMLTGRWSQDGRPLKTSTINVRVQIACAFLKWAGERGLRPSFNVLSVSISTEASSGTSSHGHNSLTVTSRAGSLRAEVKPFITLPTVDEVRRWLSSVQARRGYTKALMCRTILRTGMRRREVVEMRVDDLPERKDWVVIGGQVQMRLVHGTKGAKSHSSDGGEMGPPRTIGVPMDLAEELDQYRTWRRLKPATMWMKRNKGSPPPSRLFLGEHDGTPISMDTLYRAWTLTPDVKIDDWHPHTGRHYWACQTLLSALEQETSRAKATISEMPEAWVYEVGRYIIDTRIRPQLGHVDVETTLIYLRWITSLTVLADHYIDWHTFLEKADG
ncbi:integrase [Sinorhizobium kostiense]|uniref:Integrase n=1 Tax=Sinorhizobium kostiense TaxID=76747 RepID=A0ABS4QXA9_9HYPH|nr:site-specific integrase [Sinorhizobium kostiense]MBP2235287.1 integrase [Sinorhizobium kostiense]